MLGEAGFGLAEAPSWLDDRSWAGIREGLEQTGGALERDLLTGRRGEVLAARERLVERMKRVGG